MQLKADASHLLHTVFMSSPDTIDVRPLLARGEEPYALLRARIDGLKPGEALTVITPFIPAPLIELTRSLGMQVQPEHRSDGGWSTTISRPA
jgi:uncharacterized protein (DUF2249 family)